MPFRKHPQRRTGINMRRRRRFRRRMAKREIAFVQATVVISPITKEDAAMFAKALGEKGFGAHEWEEFPDVAGPGEYGFHAYFEDCRDAEGFRDWVNSEFE